MLGVFGDTSQDTLKLFLKKYKHGGFRDASPKRSLLHDKNFEVHIGLELV